MTEKKFLSGGSLLGCKLILTVIWSQLGDKDTGAREERKPCPLCSFGTVLFPPKSRSQLSH